MTTSPLLLVVTLCPDGKLRRGGGGGGDLEGFSVRYRGTVNSPKIMQEKQINWSHGFIGMI